MKDLTPNEIALRIAFLVAFFVTLTNLLINAIFYQPDYWSSILFFIITFFISYFGFKITIEKFIYKKIKIIYRTIHRLKLTKNEHLLDASLNENIFKRVESEVIEWDKKNKAEIERLKDLENYRREFVGNVSHELKTPIFNIQGYLLTLIEGGLADPNINEKYLIKANNSVERMITIIEDLDQITKIESGKLMMNISKFNLLDLTKEVVNSLEDQSTKNNIKISIKNNFSKPIFVLADYNKIAQVIVNLIVNAIRYGKKNGEILIKFFEIDNNILVEIADNGIGIAEEHLPRLFERFYRTDKARAREQGGSGLGLAIVKHIIEAHNQTINVRSTVNVGSTFSFTLKKA